MTTSRKSIWIFSIAAIVAIGALVLTTGVAGATDRFVGPGENYTSIQSAVTAANPFDTIIVRDGTYIENVDVDVDNVTIRSENGSASCVVNAFDQNDHVFYIAADYVNISGFTVTGATSDGGTGICLMSVDYCTISENIALNNDNGIYLGGSRNNTLTGNNASNNNLGIYLHYYSSSNNLTGNTASNNNLGIYLRDLCNDNQLNGNALSNNSQGIHLYISCNNNSLTDNSVSNNSYGIGLSSSDNNTLKGNTANSNYNSGIYLSSSNNNTLTGNSALNNYDGIQLYSSSNNTLNDNTANSNYYYGIYLPSSSNNNLTNNSANSNNEIGIYLDSSSNNSLYGNYAINNNYGIYLYASCSNNTLMGNTVNSSNNYGIFLRIYPLNNLIYNNYLDNTNNAYDDGNNIWNITKTSGTNIIGGDWLGGNFWSNYTGTDADGDGLGDAPYEILGGANKDYLPLVAIAAPHIFDTGEGTYPSIAGTHNGTIKSNQTITVSKLYTYPCAGTGGHTEYIKLWNATWAGVEAYWEGYQGDWRNISLPEFTLVAGETYNYTIRTGSYPQIIHEPSYNAIGGVITCEEFIDLNGKRHERWTLAIKLY